MHFDVGGSDNPYDQRNWVKIGLANIFNWIKYRSIISRCCCFDLILSVDFESFLFQIFNKDTLLK
jgi:hypothetical protein